MRFEFEIKLRPVRKIRQKAPMELSLRKHLVLAYQMHELLEQNKAESLQQIARWLGFNRARISQLINLLFLAPEIQTEILHSENLLITERHARQVPLEADWVKQKQIWLKHAAHLSKSDQRG